MDFNRIFFSWPRDVHTLANLEPRARREFHYLVCIWRPCPKGDWKRLSYQVTDAPSVEEVIEWAQDMAGEDPAATFLVTPPIAAEVNLSSQLFLVHGEIPSDYEGEDDVSDNHEDDAPDFGWLMFKE